MQHSGVCSGQVCEWKFPRVKGEGYGDWMSYVRGSWFEPHRS